MAKKNPEFVWVPCTFRQAEWAWIRNFPRVHLKLVKAARFDHASTDFEIFVLGGRCSASMVIVLRKQGRLVHLYLSITRAK